MEDIRTLTPEKTTAYANISTLFGENRVVLPTTGRRKFLKSPFNYIGNKYRLLGQLLPLFPPEIETMHDLFCGGLDVSINVGARHKKANDLNHLVIEIFRYFKEQSPSDVVKEIHRMIKDHNLSKDNKATYYAFRDYYNAHKHPLLLFVLVCYSFNYQFRFNSNLDYNNPAGTHRSSFNENIEQRVVMLVEELQGIELTSKNFVDLDYSEVRKGDFVYADPPYRASVGSYNDGKRGFEGWGLKEDLLLFTLLDDLDKRGIRFAMSNVFENNGRHNQALINWSKGYNVHYLDMDYSNSNYQKKNKGLSREVLITNY